MHWTNVKKVSFLHEKVRVESACCTITLITFSQWDMPYLTHNWRLPNTLQAELETMHWMKVKEASFLHEKVRAELACCPHHPHNLLSVRDALSHSQLEAPQHLTGWTWDMHWTNVKEASSLHEKVRAETSCCPQQTHNLLSLKDAISHQDTS
jgi:hypothetical protein